MIVPQFKINILGKIIYFLFFIFFKTCCYFAVDRKLQIWLRNSFHQNYFSFGNSDLDISIFFFDNNNIQKKIQIIKKISSYFLIIKEINYYYPAISAKAFVLINPYELKRDRILNEKFTFSQSSESAELKFVYLLRTYYSEAKSTDTELSLRSRKKWLYHFKNVSLDHLLNEQSLKTYGSLLDFIFLNIGESYETSNLRSAIDEYNQAKIDKLEMHKLFEKSFYKKELLILLPHVFYFASNDELIDLSKKEVRIIFAQLSWEVWALMTQVWLFNFPNTYNHLENISILNMKIVKNEEINTAILILKDYLKHDFHDNSQRPSRDFPQR
jgi:hypothetical protein